MNPNSGQRMFRPTLLPMGSMQQVVMTAGGGVFTTGTLSQPITRPVTSLQAPLTEQHMPHTQPVVMQQHAMRTQRSVPKADLYLCNTSCNASDPPTETECENKDKVSLNDLEMSFKDLESQQTKDSLSSFLPHIPGEFDRMPPDTMLRQLLEQRSIGGKNFSPLSGQALLGFRLLPGPLPEMYRIDPPTVESKPHKKRKHKHKTIEKGEVGSEGGNGPPPPSQKIKLPPDAYSFIKQDISTTSTHIPHVPTHMTTHSHGGYLPGGGGDVSVGGVIKQHQPAKEILSASFSPMIATSVAAAPVQILAGGATIIETFAPKKPKKPKKEKRKREKGEKKEKKKKKHHNQEPLGPPPSLLPHASKPFNQFPNT